MEAFLFPGFFCYNIKKTNKMSGIFLPNNSIKFETFKHLDDEFIVEHLIKSSQYESWNINHIFIENKNSAIESSFNLIHPCACYKKMKAVKWLLENGANPDLRSSNGNTALTFFCSNSDTYNAQDEQNFINGLKLFIENKVNFNSIGYDGMNALEVFLRYKKTPITQSVANIFIEQTDFSNTQILPNLVYNPQFFNIEIIQKLLNKNANFNYQEKFKQDGQQYYGPTMLANLVNLDRKDFKQIEPIIEHINKNYKFDYNTLTTFYNDNNETQNVSLLEYAIRRNSSSAFKFFTKKAPHLLNDCTQSMSLVEQCAQFNFSYGLKFFFKKTRF